MLPQSKGKTRGRTFRAPLPAVEALVEFWSGAIAEALFDAFRNTFLTSRGTGIGSMEIEQ
jgi:hypothetical protein